MSAIAQSMRSCKICGAQTKGNQGLSLHLRVHGIDYVSYKIKYEGASIPKCPICGADCKRFGPVFIKTCGNKVCAQAASEQTSIERYGTKHPAQSKVVRDKIEKTDLEKYGVKHHIASTQVKEKSKSTCLRRYGVDRPQKLESVKEKVRETNLKRYGVEYNFQTQEFKKKSVETCMQKYGVPFTSQSEQKKIKTTETCLKKYGTATPAASPIVRDKIKNTNLEKYGCENPLGNKNVREKRAKTCLEKYGFENPILNESVKGKARATTLKKYGVANSFMSAAVREKARATCVAKYGVPWASQTKQNRKKFKETCIERFGVPHPAQSAEIHHKMFSFRREKFNGYLSGAEVQFAKELSSRNVDFKNEVRVNGKHFDFAVFKDGTMSCLIEIDGEYAHGLLSDADGHHIGIAKDFLRFRKVPAGINFVVIDSRKISSELVDEALSIAYQDYEDFIGNIIANLPEEFPYPSFDEERMKKDWKHLCAWTPNRKQHLCNSVILNFHKSLWKKSVNGKLNPLDAWADKKMRERLVREHYIYWSKFSSQKIADGFIGCDIAPRADFTQPSAAKAYFAESRPLSGIVDEPLDLGRMLGACSVGLSYHGHSNDETLISEAQTIIDFLDLGDFANVRRT